MNYPRVFKERCKRAYPNWSEMDHALETGNVFVGRYLDDSRTSYIAHTKILELLNTNQIDKLKKLCVEAMEKEALYAEWCRMYDKFREV